MDGKTIFFEASDIYIDKAISIYCSSNTALTIAAAENIDRVFTIGNNGDLTLTGMKLIGGNASQGNVIFNTGKLILDDMLLQKKNTITNITNVVYNNTTGEMTLLNNTIIEE